MEQAWQCRMYWEGIWDKEASDNTNAQWLLGLGEDHSHLPEQDPVTITLADILERVLGMKSRTLGPVMNNSYWLKKLTTLHEFPAAQINQLLKDGTPRREQFHSTNSQLPDSARHGSSCQASLWPRWVGMWLTTWAGPRKELVVTPEEPNTSY